MMTTTARIVAGIAACFAMSPAFAADFTPYVTGFLGLDSPSELAIDGANAGGQARDIDIDLDDATFGGLALGVAGPELSFGRFRAEAEASFRAFDVQALALNGVARSVGSGSEASVAAGLINVFYDTPVYFDRVRFSVGAGFGVAGVDHEIRYLVANAAAIGAAPGNLQIAIPNSETTFAYQFVGGLEYRFSPNWSFVGDVRQLELGDVQAERYILNSIINGVATTNGTLDSILDSELSSTAVTAGVRFTF